AAEPNLRLHLRALVNVAGIEGSALVGGRILDMSKHTDRRNVHDTFERGIACRAAREQLGDRHMDTRVDLVGNARIAIRGREIEHVVDVARRSLDGSLMKDVTGNPIDIEAVKRRTVGRWPCEDTHAETAIEQF